MKVLLYTTEPKWKTWPIKLAACRGGIGLVKGTKSVQIDLATLQVTPRAAGGKVDRGWYNTLTIDARKRGYQAVAVHMGVAYAKKLGITKYRGCSINDETMGEVWVVADESQTITYESGRVVNRFVKVFIHEMSHWFADYLKQKDLTHYWDYEQENILLALTPYKFKTGYMESITNALRREHIRAPLADWLDLRVTQDFGTKDSTYKSGIHAGVDIAVPIGTPIYAPTDGTIPLIWKNEETLGHAFCFEFFYNGQMYTMRDAHLSEVPKRGTYRRGDVLGLSGNTGRSTGPHVHKEVWRGGYSYDVLMDAGLVRSNLVDPYILFKGITTQF